jgi:ATP-dependent DNA helicase DinG
VATATLALQHQLVERDIPRLVDAVGDRLDASYAVLKGRSNYACLHRIREGVPDDQGTLVDVPEGSMGSKVLELRAWAEEQSESGGSGERDHAPRHTDREWRQVSVGHRDCLGASRCPFGAECFAELAREKAQRSHLIVTNHSLLAIDAIEGVPMIPEYDAVVIDEAHELVARVTQAATDELSVADVERAARRSQRHVDGSEADDLADAADALADAVTVATPGRFDTMPDQLGESLLLVRDAARSCLSAYPKEAEDSADAGRTQARGSVQDVFVTAERMAADLESDVLWLAEGGERFPPRLCVAPLEVSGPMRDKLLSDKTVVFTSATLRLGGDFSAVATSVGLRPSDRVVDGDAIGEGEGTLPWQGIDVGSPFDYGQQAILYVARHLPQPGRDGLGEAQLQEIADLVDAAEGRTLGLFSSRRAAETAAEAVRERLPHLTTLAQGDAQLPELARQFVDDPHTCLFGTLSLWQGLDVPGDTCQLVIIDRIPFPRPDDPLMSARQRAVEKAGGNGFMQVAATHAALLLAQGTGRLIRTTTDRGVVAVLDPRLATARYGGFLKASLPPMWTTTDPAVVRKALARIAAG